ncbi:hypothetical protein VCHENC02_4260A, partial [Vibrio harveyi]
MNVGNNSL